MNSEADSEAAVLCLVQALYLKAGGGGAGTGPGLPAKLGLYLRGSVGGRERQQRVSSREGPGGIYMFLTLWAVLTLSYT